MDAQTPSTITESRCLVVGAASGIGFATAARLRASGVTVVGADLPSATWPEEQRDSSLAMDVTDPASVAAAVSASALEMGGLDAVVNCAGILGPVAPRPTPRSKTSNRQCPRPGQCGDPAFRGSSGGTAGGPGRQDPHGQVRDARRSGPLIEFIISPAASYTTGSFFDLSGGRATY